MPRHIVGYYQRKNPPMFIKPVMCHTILSTGNPAKKNGTHKPSIGTLNNEIDRLLVISR